MEYDVEQVALVHSLVREVQAIVPIVDDILRGAFRATLHREQPAGACGGVLCVGIAVGMTSSPKVCRCTER